jgi:hypothetical protein
MSLYEFLNRDQLINKFEEIIISKYLTMHISVLMKKIQQRIKSINISFVIKHKVYNEFISHKVIYFSVWSMNLDYMHDRSNCAETESNFTQDWINFISNQTYFIKKSLIEFQWRREKIQDNISSHINLIFRLLFFINHEIFLKC